MPRSSLLRIATLVLCLGPAAAVAERAGVPSPANATIPGALNLVGHVGGAPDAAAFGASGLVTVRDLAGNPLVGSSVTFDLGGCADLVLSSTQAPGIAVDCIKKSATMVTDGTGQAMFVLVGSGGTRTPVSAPRSARVYADGILLGTVSIGAYDQDGVNGVGADDISLWADDYFAGTNPPRSNFSGSGTVALTDLSYLVATLVAGNSAVTGPHCTGGATSTASAAGGALDLAWTAPGAAGVSTITSPCTSNSGTAGKLYASVIPAVTATDVSGYEAVLDVQVATGGTLPDWWRLDACRKGYATVFGDATIGGSMPTVWDNAGGPGAIDVYGALAGAPQFPGRERLVIVGALPASAALSGQGLLLVSGQESALFELAIANTKSTTCAGCATPVALVLESVRFTRASSCTPSCAGPDIVITTPATSNVAYWQATVNGPTPAQNRSWGALKSLYR